MVSIVSSSTALDLPPTTVSITQKLMPHILPREDIAEIRWYSPPADRNRIFQILGDNRIFKMQPESNEKIEQRFDNMMKARVVCTTHQLGLLYVPKATKFEVVHEGRSYVIIAEEFLNISHSDSLQEELFYKYAKGLTETMRQVAVFIAHTGFSDSEWRNLPLLDSHRVALIDLEHMEEARVGFLGDSTLNRRGLIRCCTTEEQIDLVIAEAKKSLQSPPTPSKKEFANKDQMEADLLCDGF